MKTLEKLVKALLFSQKKIFTKDNSAMVRKEKDGKWNYPVSVEVLGHRWQVAEFTMKSGTMTSRTPARTLHMGVSYPIPKVT